MKELDAKPNGISLIIKSAFEIKKVSPKPNLSIQRFLGFDAMQNMRNIANGLEIQVSEYKLFFEKFADFLGKEFLDKKPLKQSFLEETFRDLAADNSDITFKLEGLLEEEILKKQENIVYLKILTLLTSSNFADLTISHVLQIFNVFEFFFNKSDFFQSVDFSTKMNAIYYSFTHAKSFDTIKTLVILNDFDLLTEDNLDKLLQNSELNLEVLAKFIQIKDKSNLLTQEKFDLAINLKNLLTQENIEKIEKTAFDPKKLADVIFLSDAANILTQDNFDQLIGLDKDDFEKIVPVLDTMHGKKILNQDNLLKFLDTFLNLSIYDAEQHQINGSSPEQPSSSTLADQLCSSLVGLLSRIGKFFQEFFDDILNYFNDKTENNAENITTDNQAIDTNSRVNSRASFFGNSSSRKDIDNNEDLPPRLVSSH